MKDYERINALIAYLNALTAVSQSNVQVYTEIRRTVATLEKLLND